jgi:hypothetical protein
MLAAQCFTEQASVPPVPAVSPPPNRRDGYFGTTW